MCDFAATPRLASIRREALQNNWLRASGQQPFDVPGRAQSPYQTNVLFAAAPTISRARTNSVSFVFRRNLYLTGTGAVPSALYLDFGDGRGYLPAAWNTPLATTYATAGSKRVKVKIVFGSAPIAPVTGRVAAQAAPQPTNEVRESWFDFEVWSVAAVAKGTATANCAICDDEQPVGPSFTGGAEHSGGTAFIYNLVPSTLVAQTNPL